jgi:hypothetical protein
MSPVLLTLVRYRFALYAFALLSFLFYFHAAPASAARDSALSVSGSQRTPRSSSLALRSASPADGALDAAASDGAPTLRRRRRRKRPRVDGDVAQAEGGAAPRAWRDDATSVEDEGRAFLEGGLLFAAGNAAPANAAPSAASSGVASVGEADEVAARTSGGGGGDGGDGGGGDGGGGDGGGGDVDGGGGDGAAVGVDVGDVDGGGVDDAAVRDALAVLSRALAGAPSASDGAASDARTDAALARFAVTQAAMLRGGAGAPPPRFVAWRVTDKTSGMGLGNRLLGMISALGLAFATDRAFVILDDPILAASLEAVPPDEGGVDASTSAARAAAARAGVDFDGALHLAWGLGMDDKCACADFLGGALAATVTLSLETTQYLAPCFTHNAGLRARFVAGFGDATAIFRPLMRRFFRLRAPLREELARFGAVLHPPRARGAPRRHVVGLQIRTGHLVRPRSEEAVFYRCGLQLGALARLGRAAVTRASVDAAAGGAAAAALATLEDALLRGAAARADADADVDVFFFLATDSDAVRARARAALGADRVITYAPPAGAESGAAAVIDTWALSLCDDVVLTYPKSTFGFVGALLGATGLPPHVVVSGSKTAGECVRLTSTEPVCETGGGAGAREGSGRGAREASARGERARDASEALHGACTSSNPRPPPRTHGSRSRASPRLVYAVVRGLLQAGLGNGRHAESGERLLLLDGAGELAAEHVGHAPVPRERHGGRVPFHSESL